MKNQKAYKVFELLKENGFNPETAKIITAQAAFETGNFNSVIFLEQNNLFGMKLAKKRKTLAIDENRAHAVFNSLEDSVSDFRIYFKYFGYPETFSSVADYCSQIKEKKYFEANLQHYTKGVEFYYQMYFNE